MDSPRYSVSVFNTVRGWTLAAVHDPDLDEIDPSVRSILAAPFTYAWGFDSDVIPNLTDPDRVSFSIWSRTAADQPAIDLGDTLSIRVRMGTAGPDITRVPVTRVTEVSTELLPGEDWAVRTTVQAVDYRVELPSAFPTYDPAGTGLSANAFYLHKWALISRALGLSIGVPTSWDNGPGSTVTYDWAGSSAADHAAELLNSYVPGGVHHTLVPYFGAGYPAGYRWVDSGYTVPVGITPPMADPNTSVKLLAVPAARTSSGVSRLPLVFRNADGLLDVISTPAAGSGSMPSVSARYCEVPATVRRTRDHLVNTVIVKGINMQTSGYEHRPSTYTHTDAAAVAARGTIARTVDSQLILRYYDTDPDEPGAVQSYVPPIAASFLAQPASTLAYKEFVVRASDMPQVVAEAVIPYLTPSYPGDGLDGRVVRHLTVHSLPAEARIPDADPSGFITSGTLSIAGGDVTFVLNVTPGSVAYTATPTPITVGEFVAAGVSALAVPNVDPALVVADLDLVDA